MLQKVEPVEKGYPHFNHVYLANVKATNAKQFISASGWNDSLTLNDFTLYNLDVEAEKAGIVAHTKKFRLTDIKLKISDNSQIEFNKNSQLKKNIRYE
jgi:hypothetical protein